MARARLLKPGFFSNEVLAELGPLGQMLFAGLWTLADKKGRLDDRPKRIKAEVFPYYKADVNVLLSGLTEKGFIERYSAGDSDYIQIAKFEKHQSPHRNEPDSSIPSPSDIGGTARDNRTRRDISGFPENSIVSDWTPVAVPIAEAEAEAEAEAVTRAPSRVIGFKPLTESPFPEPPETDVESFVAIYAKHYATKNPGRSLSSAARADCIQLEQKHGREDCIDCAGLYEWDKGPGYLGEVMSDDKWRTRKTGKSAGRGANGSAAEDPSGLREWEAYAAGEDQRTPAAAPA